MADEVIDRALNIARQHGWSQAEFARRLGHDSNQRLTNWKKRGLPSSQYESVASVLGITVDHLLGKSKRTAATSHATHVLCVTQADLDALDDAARLLVLQLIQAIKGAVKGGGDTARPKPVRKS